MTCSDDTLDKVVVWKSFEGSTLECSSAVKRRKVTDVKTSRGSNRRDDLHKKFNKEGSKQDLHSDQNQITLLKICKRNQINQILLVKICQRVLIKSKTKLKIWPKPK